MVIYRMFRQTEKMTVKVVHSILQLVAFCIAVCGLVAVFGFHNAQEIPNMYSLHSWIGMATTVLFAFQVCSWNFSKTMWTSSETQGHIVGRADTTPTPTRTQQLMNRPVVTSRTARTTGQFQWLFLCTVGCAPFFKLWSPSSPQLAAGFYSFLSPKLPDDSRAYYLRLHVFFGVLMFVLVVATCLTGITEKVLFSIMG